MLSRLRLCADIAGARAVPTRQLDTPEAVDAMLNDLRTDSSLITVIQENDLPSS
jgi:hypothetical protein